MKYLILLTISFFFINFLISQSTTLDKIEAIAINNKIYNINLDDRKIIQEYVNYFADRYYTAGNEFEKRKDQDNLIAKIKAASNKINFEKSYVAYGEIRLKEYDFENKKFPFRFCIDPPCTEYLSIIKNSIWNYSDFGIGVVISGLEFCKDFYMNESNAQNLLSKCSNRRIYYRILYKINNKKIIDDYNKEIIGRLEANALVVNFYINENDDNYFYHFENPSNDSKPTETFHESDTTNNTNQNQLENDIEQIDTNSFFIYHTGKLIENYINYNLKLIVDEKSTENNILSIFGAAAYSKKDLQNEFILTNTNFKLGSAILTKESDIQLNNIVTIFKAFPEFKINISVYSGALGNDAANLKLTQERANSLKAKLIEFGFIENKIVNTIGYGSAFSKTDVTAPAKERQKESYAAIKVLN